MPEVTHAGANTAGCLGNGQPFLATGDGNGLLLITPLTPLAMKTALHCLLLLLLASGGCKKDTADPNGLPSATQEGKMRWSS